MYIYVYVCVYICICMYVYIYICTISSGSFDSLNFLATQVFGKNHPKSCKVLCVYAESFLHHRFLFFEKRLAGWFQEPESYIDLAESLYN